MTTTLSVPVEIVAVVHEIEGGGYWAEAVGLPGCIAQAETLEALRENLRRAVTDWLTETPGKTGREAEELAAIPSKTLAADPALGSIGALREDAGLLDEAVADAYRLRREEPWRESGIE